MGAEVQETQQQFVHGMSYYHPWIPTLIVTYTTSYDPLDRPETPGSSFATVNYPQVLEIEMPFGPERLKVYLRDLPNKEWSPITDPAGNALPLEMWFDP